MKRTIGQGVIVMIAFILQNTAFSALSFNGVKPNLLLIIAVFFGYAVGLNNGMLTGFFAGLLCDIFFGPYIGVYSFVFMLLGGFGGLMAKIFYQDDIIFPFVTIALADGLFGLAYYVLMFLVRGRFSFFQYLGSVILPELLYTLAVSVVLIPLLHKAHDFLSAIELKEKESDVSGLD